MKEWIQKITDIVTIVGPAAIAVMSVLGLTGSIHIAENVEQIMLIILGACSAIASVLYNMVKS
jgi:hypothetical protein